MREEDDELVWFVTRPARTTSLMVSRKGQAIRFSEREA
jgi:hypothetical protein